MSLTAFFREGIVFSTEYLLTDLKVFIGCGFPIIIASVISKTGFVSRLFSKKDAFLKVLNSLTYDYEICYFFVKFLSLLPLFYPNEKFLGIWTGLSSVFLTLNVVKLLILAFLS